MLHGTRHSCSSGALVVLGLLLAVVQIMDEPSIILGPPNASSSASPHGSSGPVQGIGLAAHAVAAGHNGGTVRCARGQEDAQRPRGQMEGAIHVLVSQPRVDRVVRQIR